MAAADETTLSATVNARVPRKLMQRITAEVQRRRRAGVWASVGDIVREALAKHLDPHGELGTECNGHR